MLEAACRSTLVYLNQNLVYLWFPNQCLTGGVLAISPKGQWSVARRFSLPRAFRYACNLQYLVTPTLKNTS